MQEDAGPADPSEPEVRRILRQRRVQEKRDRMMRQVHVPIDVIFRYINMHCICAPICNACFSAFRVWCWLAL